MLRLAVGADRWRACWEIVAKEVMRDHVHLFVRVGPTDAPASVVRGSKGRTCRVLRAEFPYLRRFAKVLWSPSYSPLRSDMSRSRRCAATSSISGERWPDASRVCVPVAADRSQHVELGQCLDAHPELHNAALQERRDAWSRSKTRINYGDQSAQLTEIPSLRTDQARWSFSSQQATLRRLKKAFAGFFRRVKGGQKAGYPGFTGPSGPAADSW